MHIALGRLLSGTIAASRKTSVPTYEVTVAAGVVATNLTDFPMTIYLSSFDASFWNAVRSDGGNVRVYAADGVTLIPHDLTYINTRTKVGRLVVKQTLTTAIATKVIVKLLDSNNTKLAVGDTNGRNAVWSDYQVVWVFPEVANRTGLSHTQSMGSILAHSEWVRTDYDALTGSPHNGICTDGTHFISTDNIVLRRMNMAYVVQQTVTDINVALAALTGVSNLDHMSDPVCVGASTFFTVTNSDVTYRRWLVQYTTATLTAVAAWEMTGAQRVFGATVCYDGTHLLMFSYTDDTQFIKYTTSGSYVSAVTLTNRPGAMIDFQGSTVMPGGNIYVSGDPLTIWEVEPSGNVLGAVYVDPHTNIMEGLENRNGTLWLLKGDGALITLRDDVHRDFRKLHGGDTAYVDLPTFSTFTMGCTTYWTITNSQQGFIGAYNLATSVGPRIVYDEGPDRLDTFSSSDSWIVPPSNDNPPAYSTRRLGLKHNGTVERKFHINGALSDTDATIVASPGGTGNARFLINGSRVGFEAGECYYQHVWLRLSYLSDAWMAADSLNQLTPTSFYSVTKL